MLEIEMLAAGEPMGSVTVESEALLVGTIGIGPRFRYRYRCSLVDGQNYEGELDTNEGFDMVSAVFAAIADQQRQTCSNC